MADSPQQAARRFKGAGNRVEQAARRGESMAGAHVKTTILAIAPASLRNARKRANSHTAGTPVKLGVWTSRDKFGTGVLVAARGPWQLIERDTKAHLIGGGRSRFKEVRSYMQFASGDIRLGPVMHPGTTGQHPFRKGVEASRPAVPRIIDENVKGALYRSFGF